MELTVTQENLTKALSAVGRVASTRTQLPILGNILLKTDSARLLIAATNLEIASTQYIGAKITNPGSITIPAKLVSEFISNLPKEQVKLRVENEKLHINCAGYHSIINGVIADEFPELPTIDESSSINYNITSLDFKQATSQTIIAASNDTTRPVLTGVYWHSEDGKLYLTATDGYRLAQRRLMDTKSDLSAIIPSHTLQEVLRIITDDTDAVDILFDETQVRFRVNDAEIVSRLIDGKFPPVQQLIPKDTTVNSVLKKEDFVRITKVASLFARDSGGSVTLSLNAEADTLSIHSIASEFGENTSEAPATIDSDGQITLNSRYITDALSAVDSDEITFSFTTKLAPSVLSSTEKDPDYHHVIMPLKS